MDRTLAIAGAIVKSKQLLLFAPLYDLALRRRGITIGSGAKAIVATIPFQGRTERK